MALPDFFLIGAPKAGTTALHAALARHPGLYLSPVKEPKYFLVRRRAARGPGRARRRPQRPRVGAGDRDRYEALFERRPDGRAAGREHAVLPVRPGRPPAHQARRARRPARSPCSATPSTGRTRTGCTCGRTGSSPSATSWRPATPRTSGSPPATRRSGTTAPSAGTASSSTTCTRCSTARRSTCCATASWSTRRSRRWPPSAASSAWTGWPRPRRPRTAAPTWRDTPRPGRWAGSSGPGPPPVPACRPQVLAARQPPAAVAARHRNGARRPVLSPDERRVVLAPLADDIALPSEVTGQSFADWLGDRGRGEFGPRAEAAPASTPTRGR